MPVSTRRYLELRLTISDYLQRRSWMRLLEVCGTSDDETAKTIAVIFSLYDPKNTWKFLEYAAGLSAEERRRKRDSIATCCYIIGKMGQDNTSKALSLLRLFLSDDHMLRAPVLAALSNLWVLDTRKTATIVFDSWVMDDSENEDLQEIGIRSSEFLVSKEPRMILAFLKKVSALASQRKVASKISDELLEQYLPGGIPRPISAKRRNDKAGYNSKKM
jgi:hypothetical protein